LSLQITAEQLLREVRPDSLTKGVHLNADLSNRLKNDKRLHFAHLNNELKISRNSANTVDVKEGNLRNEFGGQEGACGFQYFATGSLSLTRSVIQKRMVAICELGGMSLQRTCHLLRLIFIFIKASQNEFARSRSIFERALDVDPRSIQLWLSYTEMELKSRNVQHARNLFDRAVTLLPRVDQLWYKYVYLEELLQNVPGARQVFERWMQWEPDDKAWQAYIKLEERYQELDRSSAIYERWVAVRPEPRVWVKWGKFEEDRSRVDKAREVFQTALEFYGDDEEQVEKAQAVFNAFAKMETRLKEYERARVIYKVCSSIILIYFCPNYFF